KQCASCDKIISDRYLLLAADKYWHVTCLRCTSCHVVLSEVGSTCFSKSGMTLCRSDYIRLFGSTGTCSLCRQTIPANDYVMKTSQGSVYHVTCFICITCRRALIPGDKYGVYNGSLFCETDYWVAMTTG
ncbi:hypothetical protein HELRODRAFT_145858, partial [Helobdella robusta]|uniref:LIM zinc-binding domain-containing protein n=1 Tax=Helobdella robusta TaxID=6412 RepID=T1EJN4_HELRO